MPQDPVQNIPGDALAGGPQPAIGPCLSGGGYRAMVFHLGALWRLYDAGLLRTVNRISSVSGGSITAALLGLKWPKLSFDPARLQSDFVPELVQPIRSLASETIDAEAIILGVLLPGRASDRVAAAYEQHLFGSATLQDLPDTPRFVINATNVQSGVLWRFSKVFMRDYRVGEVKHPTVPIARAVGRVVGVSSGIVAGRAARRSQLVHTQLWRRSAAPAVHDQGHLERRRRLRQPRTRDGLEAV